MKLLFLVTSIALTFVLLSQKPEKVHSIVKERKSFEWYTTQASVWSEETVKNSKNAEAWYNYYSATRALKNISWGDSAAVSKYAKQCNKIAEDAYKAVPKSFEANHLVWWNAYNDRSKFSYLEKAYEINPLDPRTYRDLMIHYVLEFNDVKTKEFAEKIFKVNEMPASAYNWAYNILAEADKNAIIFTGGDNDTYLPWIVQQVLGFRQDVTIMNTSLLGDDKYRNGLFSEIGMPAFTKSLETCKTYQEMLSVKKALYEHIFANNDKFPVYVLSSVVDQFKNDFDDKLYLVGLNYQYCESTIDNLAIIKRNYEKRYQLDYLLNAFSFHSLAKKGDDFNVYYLQAFIKLHKHYIVSEANEKAEIIRKQIISIAQKGGQEQNLQDWINEYQ